MRYVLLSAALARLIKPVSTRRRVVPHGGYCMRGAELRWRPPAGWRGGGGHTGHFGSSAGRVRPAGLGATAVSDLITHIDEINRLNVFPVADSDTGANMLFTMRSALAQASKGANAGANAGAASEAGRGASLGSRRHVGRRAERGAPATRA